MKRRNRGQILVLFTLSLIVLIGMAALGVDVGYMYSVRHDLQRCADAGALAGASRFINNPAAGETGSWADAAVQAEATARAIDYASKDNVVQTPLLSQPGDNVIVTFDQGPDRIKVLTERTVPLFFSKMFLGLTKRITAYAVAEAASVSQNATCIAPFAIPIPWEERGSDPYSYDNSVTEGDIMHWPMSKTELDEKCQQFDQQGEITQWDYHTHDNASVRSIRDAYLCPGALLKLKVGDPQAAQPGWFRPLNLQDYAQNCPSMADPIFYTYMIKNSRCGEGDCRIVLDTNDPTQQLNVLTGNKVGPTVQAIAPGFYPANGEPGYSSSSAIDWDSLMDGRINQLDPANYTRTNYDDRPTGQGGADWRIPPNGPRSGVTSRRIIRVPLYDPRIGTEGSGANAIIKPVAFAGLWVQDITPISQSQGTITGRLIEVTGPGTGPGPGEGGATVKTIRLVE